MRFIKTNIAALSAAVVLAACGGGGDREPLVPFNSIVSFGDSLSDVGTYKVGTVAAVGGGKFTVNGPNAATWVERLAADVGLPAPCPAQTGLLPNLPGFTGAAVVQNTQCTDYAQGSSRVSGIYAPNSASLQAPPFNQVNIGLTAVPLTTQIATHLSRKGGSFSGTELVTVFAGANDAFMNIGGVAAAAAGGAGAVGAAAAAGWSSTVQNQVAAGGPAAVNAAAAAAVTTMGATGAELANLVKTQIIGKGAKYVTVVNLPDVSQTPYALTTDAQTRGLINQMVTAFNTQLAAGLNGVQGVVFVDAYTQGRTQTANPQQYGLTNVTSAACSTTSPNNPLPAGSSLGCTANSLVAGDTSRYAYADSVHPAPYAHQLLAQFVEAQFVRAGWLPADLLQ